MNRHEKEWVEKIKAVGSISKKELEEILNISSSGPFSAEVRSAIVVGFRNPSIPVGHFSRPDMPGERFHAHPMAYGLTIGQSLAMAKTK